MKIKQNYRDDAVVVESKHFRLILGDNEYNLSENDNGEIEILKSLGEFSVDEGRCVSEVIIRPSSSNCFSFK